MYFLLFQLTVELYEMLEQVDAKSEHLSNIDSIADFLYPFKAFESVIFWGILYIFFINFALFKLWPMAIDCLLLDVSISQVRRKEVTEKLSWSIIMKVRQLVLRRSWSHLKMIDILVMYIMFIDVTIAGGQIFYLISWHLN